MWTGKAEVTIVTSISIKIFIMRQFVTDPGNYSVDLSRMIINKVVLQLLHMKNRHQNNISV